MASFRFVNATDQTIYLPNPRGSRTALRPGEAVKDPYFARFARAPHEKVSPSRPLVKVVIEGASDEKTVRIPVPPSKIRPVTQPRVVRGTTTAHLLSSYGPCITACESACMTIAEFGMEQTEAPPKKVAEVQPPKKEKAKEKPMEMVLNVDVPPEPVEEVPVVEETVQPVQEEVPVPEEVETPPEEEEKIKTTPTLVLLDRHGYEQEDVRQETENWVFVIQGNNRRYLSKLDPNFTCKTRTEMNRHIKSIRGQL